MFYGQDQYGIFPVGGVTFEGGSLYGTTQMGGGEAGSGQGTIFKYTISTGLLTTLHIFEGRDGANPNSNLVYSGGFLYGTTPTGGSKKKGTIFKIDPRTSTLTTLYNLGSFSGLAYKAGFLYGSIENTLYNYDTRTNLLTALFTLTKSDGLDPVGIPDILGGYIFGTTGAGGASGDGTVFRIQP